MSSCWNTKKKSFFSPISSPSSLALLSSLSLRPLAATLCTKGCWHSRLITSSRILSWGANRFLLQLLAAAGVNRVPTAPVGTERLSLRISVRSPAGLRFVFGSCPRLGPRFAFEIPLLVCLRFDSVRLRFNFGSFSVRNALPSLAFSSSSVYLASPLLRPRFTLLHLSPPWCTRGSPSPSSLRFTPRFALE